MSEGLAASLAHKDDPTRSLQVIQVQKPAAGAEFTHVFAGEFVRRIIAVSARLVTSAVVANRQMRLDVNAPEGRVLSVPMVANATATLTTELTWAEGITPPNTALYDGVLVAGFPDLIIPPGWSLSTVTAAIDVGDQYSNVFIVCESWEAIPWTHYKEKLASYREDDIIGALNAQEG